MYEVKRFYKGEVIFKENSVGEYAYVIKEGRVEISKSFGDKSLVLELLGQNEIFGEMALLSVGKRTATARAQEHCELIEIEKSRFSELLVESPKIVQMLIKSLIERLKKTTSRLKVGTSDDIFISVCSLLDLLCHDVASGDTKSINRSEVIAKIKSVLSISRTDLEVIIDQLASMNLLASEDRKREGKFVSLVDAPGFLAKAKKAYQHFSSAIPLHHRQHTELADINDLAGFIGVSVDNIYRKMAFGEVPEQLFYFHKDDAFSWAAGKGKEFFERKSRRQFDPKKCEQLDDLVHLDDDSLRGLLGKVDVHKLCALMKYAEEDVKEKVFANLSGRMRKIVSEEVANLGDIDSQLLEAYEEEFIELVKGGKQSALERPVSAG